MNRKFVLAYGGACYLAFIGTFLYCIGFLANFAVPKSIDSGAEPQLFVAIGVNLALLAVFALQHSVMARIGFKKWWTKIVPEPIERSTYVLLSSVAMIGLFWGWRPMTVEVWNLGTGTAATIAHAAFGIGIATVLYSTFLIDHFDLFGLRQVVGYFRGAAYAPKTFVTPSLYKHIRHPLYVGWLITFWATPQMTLGHLLFAVICTAYIVVAIAFEERDLDRLLGAEYREYRENTPMFVPRPRRTERPQPHTA